MQMFVEAAAAPNRDAGVTERPLPYAGLNLQVTNLDTAIERAVAHGATLTEIREAQPRVPVRLGELVDPEGNGFELRQQID